MLPGMNAPSELTHHVERIELGIDPGETPQPWHADDRLLPLPRPHVPTVCATMWAITDLTAEDGATRLAPGSHRTEGLPPPFGDIEGAIAAEMPRGSALVCKGSLWRGGGPNTTGARLRKLCGWGLDKKLLGHIDKCSPGYLLEGTPPKKVVGEV